MRRAAPVERQFVDLRLNTRIQAKRLELFNARLPHQLGSERADDHSGRATERAYSPDYMIRAEHDGAQALNFPQQEDDIGWVLALANIPQLRASERWSVRHNGNAV